MSKLIHSVRVNSNHPVRFPQQCVYCLRPVSQKRDKELEASYSYEKGTKKITHTYRQKLKGIPLCQAHADLSDKLSNIYSFIIFISIILGIGAAVTLQVTTHWVKEVWSGQCVGLLFGTLFTVFILIGIGKLIAGLFNREMRVTGATGGTIGMRAHLELDKDTKQPKTILLYFENGEYLKLFCELNELV